MDILLSFPVKGSGIPKDKISNDWKKIVDILIKKKLLIKNKKEDNLLLDQMRNKGSFNHQGRISLMYFIPTNTCNLACTYCFVRTDLESNPMNMSRSIAKKAVRYFFQHSKGVKRRKIIFYGGEPLLNPNAIFVASDEAMRLDGEQNNRSKLQLSLITNGTLITPDIAGKIASRNISVSVSIDGPERINDKYRKTISGGTSFQNAIRAIKTLRDVGVNPSISCTITPFSLNQWDEVLDFIVNKIKVKGLGFNLLLPSNDSNYTKVTYTDLFDPTKAILEAFGIFRNRGIYEDRVMRRVTPFVNKKFHYKDCLGVGGQIVVSPDGSVGPCQGFLGQNKYFPLNIERDYDFPIYSNPLFQEWTKRFPLNMDECVDCAAISICGGGCPLAALREGGSIWNIDNRICYQVKPIHEWLMWDLFEKTNAKLV